MIDTSSRQTQDTILIVEDDRFSRQLVETVLKPHGYHLLFAQDGKEAIEIATQSSPTLVLLDLKLPGIDGHEVVKRLKSEPETSDIPVVALTAHAVGSERQRAMEAGCVGYIIKPIDTRAFADQVKRYVGS